MNAVDWKEWLLMTAPSTHTCVSRVSELEEAQNGDQHENRALALSSKRRKHEKYIASIKGREGRARGNKPYAEDASGIKSGNQVLGR